MPNIKSAKKRVKVGTRQAKENVPVRGSMRTAVKKAVKDKETLNDAIKRIDKAAAKGIIKKNTAARKKSSLMKKVNAK
ncbi:MAG TPA: 30S ribosomal protein S20 [Bacilli bacterium]|nr:30S ribosomal protein S20 [Bacilli bacterium]